MKNRIGKRWNSFRDLVVRWWYGVLFRKEQFLKRRPHRSFRRTRRRDYARSLKLPGYIAFTHYVNSTLWRKKRLFGSLVLLYSLTMIFLGVMTNQSTYDSISKLMNQSLGSVFSGGLGGLANATLLTLSALSIDPTSLTAQQGFMFTLSILIVWLTTVWLLRESLIGRKPKLRDGLYNACTPLISTLVVAVFFLIQLVPLGILAMVYSALTSVGILQNGFGMMLFGLLVAAVAALVLYWTTSTIIALVVIALPGMYPFQAIRAAGDLVIGRRMRIMLRLVWALLTAALFWCIVMIPLVMLERWLSSSWSWLGSVPVVPIVGVLFMSLIFVWIAAYVYLLYRKVVADDADPA